MGGFGFVRIRGEHFFSKPGGPPGDFVEVAVVGFEGLAFETDAPLTLVRTITERGEERFPFFVGSFRKSVSVGRRGHWR